MAEIVFTETSRGYESEAITLEGNVFGLHLEFPNKKNEIKVLRSLTGEKYIVAKEVTYCGAVFDATFTDALPGMSIKIITNNEPDEAIIIE